MPTVFKRPINNLTTTLAANYVAGSGTMTVRAGDGARFGAVSVDSPVRFTCVAASVIGQNGQIAPGGLPRLAIFSATGVTADTLTGVTVQEGTTDQAFSVDDFLTAAITAGTIQDIQTAVNALESGEGGVSAQVATNTADIATNAGDIATQGASLAAHVADTANPHAVTAAQVGSSVAQWNASSLLGRVLDAGVSPSGGQGLLWNATTTTWVAGGPFWDFTLNRLGIGTGTPGAGLTVDASVANTEASAWMVCGGGANKYATLLFGEGFNTGDYAEVIRFNQASDAGNFPSDLIFSNFNHRIIFSTAFDGGYRPDLILDDGKLAVGTTTTPTGQCEIVSKDVARPAQVLRGATGQTANVSEIRSNDGADTILFAVSAAGVITGDGSGLAGLTQGQVSGLDTSLAAKAPGPPVLDPALRAWRAALATVASGTGTAEISLLGDSIGEGFNTADHTTDSFAALLRDRLQHAFGGSGTGMVPLYRTSTEDSLYPPYWTLSGTWTNQNGSGPYASGEYASGGDYAEIVVTGDTADIYHLLSSSGVAETDAGAATWSVDGGAATKFNTFAASNTETKLTISLGSYGSHTVRITAPTDTHVVILWGLTARKSTGCYVHNLGKTGAVAKDILLGFSGVGTDDSAQWLGTLNSDLVIIAYGSNDYWFQVPIAEYKAHVTTLITGAQAAGSSVMLLATNPRGNLASPTIPQSDYWQALSDLATQYGCAYLSMGSRWKDVATQQAIGFDSGDTVHPNAAGHVDYYIALADAIGIPTPATQALSGDGSNITGVVHTTGAETIGGAKTFTDPIGLNGYNWTVSTAGDPNWGFQARQPGGDFVNFYMSVNYGPDGTNDRRAGFYVPVFDEWPAYADTHRNFQVTNNLNVGVAIKVGGTQVVGAQGAAIADATDAASVITQLNALLAELRTHGILAT